MSVRLNAPYKDEIDRKTNSIIYEGHDARVDHAENPKSEDQPFSTPNGTLTENGKFFTEAQSFKMGIKKEPHNIKVYEKIKDGMWCYKGFYALMDAKYLKSNDRMVFKFYLSPIAEASESIANIKFTRFIPTTVKIEVWNRDGGKCVKCGSTEHLHFDHDLPFSKGGTGLTADNIRILCMKHNLEKSDKIMCLVSLIA